jgi:LDH2 family malate/lactate/ureidoglycolate dehydrogenase
MFNDPLSERRNLGHYFSAIRIDAFTDQDEFESRLQKLAEDVRSEPRVDEDVPIQVPGDPEKDRRKTRESDGIPIPKHDLERFDSIATDLGIPSITDCSD